MPTLRATFGSLGIGAPGHGRDLAAASAAWNWPGGPCPFQALRGLARAKLLETCLMAMPTLRATFGSLGIGAPGHGRDLAAASAASDGIGLEVLAPARLFEFWLGPNS